jgi:hypothetical protein
MEPGMAVVKGEEPIHGELSTEIIIFARKHLLAHACPDLGLEIENCPKSEITPLVAPSDDQ